MATGAPIPTISTTSTAPRTSSPPRRRAKTSRGTRPLRAISATPPRASLPPADCALRATGSYARATIRRRRSMWCTPPTLTATPPSRSPTGAGAPCSPARYWSRENTSTHTPYITCGATWRSCSSPWERQSSATAAMTSATAIWTTSSRNMPTSTATTKPCAPSMPKCRGRRR